MNAQNRLKRLASLLILVMMLSLSFVSASSQCSDGIDNDGDGFADYNSVSYYGDPGCDSSSDDDESNVFPSMYLPDMPSCTGNYGDVDEINNLGNFYYGMHYSNDPLDWVISTNGSWDYGNELDWYWLWISAPTYVVWDFGSMTNYLRVFPGIDFTDRPEELDEYIVEVSSDNVNWDLLEQTAIYVDDINNLRAHDGVKDYYSSDGFRYTKISGSGLENPDFEIDAIKQCNLGCNIDSDCGVDRFIGDAVCYNDDVYQNWKDFSCGNSGTLEAACTDYVELVLVEDCVSGCSNGSCIGGVILPDLYIGGGYIPNAPILDDDEAMIRFHTHKINGDAIPDSVPVEIYLNDVLISAIPVLPFDSEDKDWGVGLGVLDAGEYELKIITDPANIYEEEYEDNNLFVFNFEVESCDDEDDDPETHSSSSSKKSVNVQIESLSNGQVEIVINAKNLNGKEMDVRIVSYGLGIYEDRLMSVDSNKFNEFVLIDIPPGSGNGEYEIIVDVDYGKVVSFSKKVSVVNQDSELIEEEIVDTISLNSLDENVDNSNSVLNYWHVWLMVFLVILVFIVVLIAMIVKR
ncbi:MAG: hypothetical protein KKF56_01235 [Nanoarchaeota archaeon]|nr:hypothetical protein [Nanoarchaeota archaeon]